MNNNQLKGQNPNEAVFAQLLNTVSNKLGCTPTQLKQQLENGSLERQLFSDSSNPQLQKLKQAANDPNAAQKLLNDPKTAAVLKKLSK
ncbi:MAG: hypothetical protein LUE12_05845 [Ruminococcus sp.]|nr:hypothetical protein [Ruminococcus sp.]